MITQKECWTVRRGKIRKESLKEKDGTIELFKKIHKRKLRAYNIGCNDEKMHKKKQLEKRLPENE